MERLTCDNPQTNTEHLLNFAYAKNGKVYLRWADGAENVDLCDYIANNACCTEVDATEVMLGACLECDNRVSALYRVAVQAAELRARLAAYEDTDLTPDEIKRIVDAYGHGHTLRSESAERLEIVREIPTDRLRDLAGADVVPVKHGHWKQCFEDWRKQIEGDKCSACGFEHYGCSIKSYSYCPNCGARMDGGAK